MSVIDRRETHVFRYVPAILKENKEWYIEFQYAAQDGKMRRCRKYLNCVVKRFRTVRERRSYALQLAADLNVRLAGGWTPEVDTAVAAHPRHGTPIEKVLNDYRAYLLKEEQVGNLRHRSKRLYTSYASILETWMKGRVQFVYQLTADALRDWLLWAKEEKGVSTKTAQCYRRWACSFCSWCVDRGFMPENPTEDVKVEATAKEKRDLQKQAGRKYISRALRDTIFSYFERKDKRMLLACYLCYYCFIRPKEIMLLTVADIDLRRSMVHIPDDVSKNGMDGWVTLPDVVANLVRELGIDDCPGDWNVFNRKMMPAKIRVKDNGTAIRNRWDAMRTVLDVPEYVVFYNLKHTGITDMLARVSTPRAVQLQARHHSLEQTEEYAQKVAPTANEEIVKYS